MTGRETFVFPPVAPEFVDAELNTSAELRAEYAAAMPHPEPCRQNCDGPEEQHPVTWRLHPRPGPFPKPDAVTDLVECCTCCAWSCSPEGFVARLERERFDDHDVEMERLVNGRWGRFEQRFEGAA